jgi:hypothetical protein
MSAARSRFIDEAEHKRFTVSLPPRGCESGNTDNLAAFLCPANRCGSCITAITLGDVSHDRPIAQPGDNAFITFLGVARQRQQTGEIARWLPLN